MIEDCLKELRTAIQDDLPALLDAEDTEYSAADDAEFGAAFPLEDIATIRFEATSELMPQNLPAVFLLPRGGTADNPWMTAETNLVHTVDCIFVATDTNPERLARRVFRYCEAFRRMLTTNVEGTGVASDPVFQTDIQRIDYTDVFDLETGGLAKSGVVTVDLHELESRP